MSTAPPSAVTVRSRAVQAASYAVFAVFVLNGFNFASWASRIPAVRDGLDLSPQGVGVLLLIGAIGSLLALPLAGLVVQRLGATRTVVFFALVNTTGLVIAALGVGAGQIVVVAGGLVIFGIGTGVWDAAMNLEGAFVEQHLGRTVMPRYHAGFSVGTMLGAGVGALAAAASLPIQVHVPLAVVVSFLLVLVSVRWFLPAEQTHAGPDLAGEGATSRARHAFGAWLEPRTLLIGLVVMAAALTEGSANDWVGLAVVDGFDASHEVGALTFGLFVTAMTAMRFFGTGLLDRFGRVTVLRLCAVLSLVGLVAFGLGPVLWIALIGVVLWGMGAALGFPVGMSAASDDPLRAAARVSVVSTIGYSAFLAGPPLLGLLAEAVGGYRQALLFVGIPVVIGLLVVKAAAPLPPTAASTAAAAAPHGTRADASTGPAATPARSRTVSAD